MNNDLTVILLAGGSGKRFGGATPKQFLQLGDTLVVMHSFRVFQQLSFVSEIVVVCDPLYRHYFPESVRFAHPGERRQDSVYYGLLASQSDAPLVCIHDGARPFITAEIVERVHAAASEWDAAAAGMPVTSTVKQHNGSQFVTQTLDRSTIWEIQTPQIIKRPLLTEGFRKALQHNLTVTDDISLVEPLGCRVKLVEGAYRNIKITTQDDLVIAKCLLEPSYV